MKIRRHSESHIVELDDGSTWRVFPGDIDVTLNWQPDTDLKLVLINDEVNSHALVSATDNSRVRVIPGSETWPVKEVKTILKEGSLSKLAPSNPPILPSVTYARLSELPPAGS